MWAYHSLDPDDFSHLKGLTPEKLGSTSHVFIQVETDDGADENDYLSTENVSGSMVQVTKHTSRGQCSSSLQLILSNKLKECTLYHSKFM